MTKPPSMPTVKGPSGRGWQAVPFGTEVIGRAAETGDLYVRDASAPAAVEERRVHREE
jgi:hypothetical protein